MARGDPQAALLMWSGLPKWQAGGAHALRGRCGKHSCEPGACADHRALKFICICVWGACSVPPGDL
jgi:hypothetical protein